MAPLPILVPQDAGPRAASSQGAYGTPGAADGGPAAQQAPDEAGGKGGLFHRVSSITSMLR